MDKRFTAYLRLLGLGLIMSLFACQTALSPQAYVKWVKDPSNGLRKEKNLGDYQLAVQLVPTAMQLLNLNYETASPEQQEALRSDAEQTLTFQLAMRTNREETSVLTHQLASVEDYQKRLNYMAFEMEQDLYLIAGTDTLAPQLYHFERTFNLSNELRCLISFDRPIELPQKASLVLEDKLMGLGPVHFPIMLSTLNKQPQLKR